MRVSESTELNTLHNVTFVGSIKKFGFWVILALYILIDSYLTTCVGSNAAVGFDDIIVNDTQQLMSLSGSDLNRKFVMSQELNYQLNTKLRAFGKLRRATPLIIAIGTGQFVDAAYLLGKGASANESLAVGQTPLWALTLTTAGDTPARCQLARLLIEHGANLQDARPTGGIEVPSRTPVDATICKYDLELTEVFLEHGAIPSKNTIEHVEFQIHYFRNNSDDPDATKRDIDSIREIALLLMRHGYAVRN